MNFEGFENCCGLNVVLGELRLECGNIDHLSDCFISARLVKIALFSHIHVQSCRRALC